MDVTKKVVFEVDYNDLDKAITEFLRSKGVQKEFEIVAYEELHNDMSKTYNIGKYDWSVLREGDKEEILHGDLHYQTNTILDWMFQDGLIEAGEYLVKIS